jgi:Phage protein Gp138 N-terminal domain
MSTAPTTPGLTPSQLNYADSAQWKQFVRQALADTRCGTPAFLVADMGVGSAPQTVTAQIAIQERVRVPAGQAWYDIPPIINVPVQMPRGGGFSVTLPLKKGDEGFLVFSDTCFDNWWLNGQNNAPPAQNQPPLPGPSPSGTQRQFEVRRHYVHDCVFVPGVWSQPNVLENYSTDSLQIRTDDGATVIDVSESGVRVKGATVTAANGGAALALVNDTFFQYFVTKVQPFLVSLGFTGTVPAGCETTILKGQ